MSIGIVSTSLTSEINISDDAILVPAIQKRRVLRIDPRVQHSDPNAGAVQTGQVRSIHETGGICAGRHRHVAKGHIRTVQRNKIDIGARGQIVDKLRRHFDGSKIEVLQHRSAKSAGFLNYVSLKGRIDSIIELDN